MQIVIILSIIHPRLRTTASSPADTGLENQTVGDLWDRPCDPASRPVFCRSHGPAWGAYAMASDAAGSRIGHAEVGNVIPAVTPRDGGEGSRIATCTDPGLDRRQPCVHLCHRCGTAVAMETAAYRRDGVAEERGMAGAGEAILNHPALCHDVAGCMNDACRLTASSRPSRNHHQSCRQNPSPRNYRRLNLSLYLRTKTPPRALRDAAP